MIHLFSVTVSAVYCLQYNHPNHSLVTNILHLFDRPTNLPAPIEVNAANRHLFGNKEPDMSNTIDHSSLRPVISTAYDGVRTKRILAVLIDWALVLALCVPVALVIFLLGVVTFGLGFFLYAGMFPAMALLYSGVTMGGDKQATIGMRLMDIHVERIDGQKVDFLTAVAHTFLFWAGNVVATPLILLVTLFTENKRAVHDLLTESVVKRGNI
jgi:uncharacterized RDD family membrane protein YckC